jgi:hypothetical protein
MGSAWGLERTECLGNPARAGMKAAKDRAQSKAAHRPPTTGHRLCPSVVSLPQGRPRFTFSPCRHSSFAAYFA